MTEQAKDTIVGARGEVKWFDSRKGFGFIVGSDEVDVLVHYSAIVGSGYRSLRDGAEVEYDAQRTDRGWKATRVVCHPSIEVPDRTPPEESTEQSSEQASDWASGEGPDPEGS